MIRTARRGMPIFLVVATMRPKGSFACFENFANWKSKTRASANPIPVVRQLAEILNAYRNSVGDPSSGVMFQSGGGDPVDLDKLAQLVIRPVVELIVL